MKKRIILTICSLILAVLLAGCDKNENEADMGHDFRVTEQNASTNESTITSEVVIEPALYEKMPEWDAFYEEYGNYYNAIQIEDMFFYTGMLGADVVKAVENSADKEIIAVSGDKLVEADEDEYLYLKNETKKITYYRGDEPWFDVYVRNYSGSLLPYSECLVSLVLPREAAIEYCRMIDGSYTSTSMTEIRYIEYEDFATKLQELGYSVSQKENKWTISNESKHSMASVMQGETLKSIYWTWQEMDTVLEIDLDTGYVVDVTLSTYGNSSYGVYGKEIPADFDWQDETFKNSVITHFMKEDFYELDKLENIELVSLFQGDNKGHFIAVFSGNKEDDGKYRYIACADRNIGIDVKNEMADLTVSIDEWFYTINRAEESSYAEVLEEVYSYQFDEDAKLLYEYKEGVIKEYKEVNSFADISAEELNTIIEAGFDEAVGAYGWNYNGNIVEMHPCYITFGNAEKEGTHLKNNTIWMIIMFNLEDEDQSEWTEYVFASIGNIYINEETKEVVWDRTVKNGGSYRYDNFWELLERRELMGTPEENKWVTELLPHDLWEKLYDAHNYIMWEGTVEAKESE